MQESLPTPLIEPTGHCVQTEFMEYVPNNNYDGHNDNDD